MSAGAVFKLIANDGKADRMIMATALLNQRIKDVMCARASAGKEDPTPTLVDLEKTHILYVNAHFKPFAAIGFEYNKVRASSGNPTLGSTVQFSIPQFGDFFYDMVLRTRLSQFQGVQWIPPAISAGAGTGTYSQAVIFDAYGRIANSAAGTTVASSVSTPTASANALQNLVRYCEYPANRLVANVRFDVNGNPLDQYSSNVSIMLEKFTIPVGKRDGYNRLTGQQVPRECYSAPVAVSVTDGNSMATPTGITCNASNQSNLTVGLSLAAGTGTGFANTAGTTVAATVGGYTAPSSLSTTTLNANLSITPATNIPAQFNSTQKLTYIVDGPQTPKPVQPALELWHKLKFWFCDDVRLAIPSVSIPFGQRFITVQLGTQNQLAYEFPSYYFATTSTLTSAGTATSAAGLLTDGSYLNPIITLAGTTPITVEAMELYINNIFVNPEIHDIYIKRIGFSLIRVYREQITNETQNTAGSELLSQLKWPIEYMFVGLQPAWNTSVIVNTTVTAVNSTSGTTTGTTPAAPTFQSPSTAAIGNLNAWRDWHRMSRQVDARFTGYIGGLGGALDIMQYGLSPEQYWLPVSTADSLSLVAHGITIYDTFQDLFFSSYLPYNYGGAALNTPNDQGAFFINFALFPRSYQPSGHLNISRARETYLNWTTQYVSANSSVYLIVVAVAINFLLISDGSAVLRYST